MAKNKSTTMIVVGLIVVILGGGVLFLLVRHSAKTSPGKTSLAQTTTTTSTTVAPGTVSFPATTPTTVIQFKIPTGDNAVAIQMDYFAGGGGYVTTGDEVNVFALAKGTCSDPTNQPTINLVESNVKVLSVIGQPPAQTGQPGSFLLGVTPSQAEKLVFQQTFNQLYFTLVVPGGAAVALPQLNCATAA